jgi:hypothetical protein
MDEGISRFITQYVDYSYMDSYTWKLTEQRGLECVTCPATEQTEEEDETRSLRDFDEVEISGKFDVKISQGHDYSVELIGPEREKEKYNLYRSGATLVIEYQGTKKFNWHSKDLNMDDMRINIIMPSLEKLEATGMGSIRFEDFGDTDMEIESRGPIQIRGELRAQNLTINLTGKSEADLSGSATNLNARLELASKLRAYNLDVVDAMVEVSGASSAKVSVSGALEIEEGMGSNVDYRGNPSVVKRD